MNVVFSLILLAAALGCIVFLLTRQRNTSSPYLQCLSATTSRAA